MARMGFLLLWVACWLRRGLGQNEYGPNRPQATTTAASSRTAVNNYRAGLAAADVAQHGQQHQHGQAGRGQRSENDRDSGEGWQEQPDRAQQFHRPMKRTVPSEKSSTQGSRSTSLSFGWVDFITPPSGR
jgi:hypothetical protein